MKRVHRCYSVQWCRCYQPWSTCFSISLFLWLSQCAFSWLQCVEKKRNTCLVNNVDFFEISLRISCILVFNVPKLFLKILWLYIDFIIIIILIEIKIILLKINHALVSDIWRETCRESLNLMRTFIIKFRTCSQRRNPIIFGVPVPMRPSSDQIGRARLPNYCYRARLFLDITSHW